MRFILIDSIDGVAPRAKMNQQRSRRFRSAKEAQEKDAERKEFMSMTNSRGEALSPEELAKKNQKTWDSNAITPGTPFMDILAASLRYWVTYKINTDKMWANLKILISDATVPGEGEHKIMQFIRSQRGAGMHDPNTKHVLYGLDADLIMLGLATHEPHFRVLREDVFYQDSKGGRKCHTCGQQGHIASECRGTVKEKQGEFDEKGKTPELKPFIWLQVSTLREYLAIEMFSDQQGFQFDLERAIDDWVFMCFFVGNDFLPHLPSLEIRDQGIDTLTAIWRDNLPVMGGYVTKDGHVDLERVQIVLRGLAKQEDAIFKGRKEVEDRKERGKRRRMDEQQRREDSSKNIKSTKYTKDYAPVASDLNLVNLDSLRNGSPKTPNAGSTKLTHDMVMNRSADNANQANKSAAAVLKERIAGLTKSSPASNATAESPTSNSDATGTPSSVLGKRKADDVDGEAPATPSKAGAGGPSQTDDSDGPPTGDVRMWEAGYRDRYYEQKFHVDPSDHEFRHQICRSYVEGLAWVLLYYYQGCPSWTWYYPYHYAPFAADFEGIADMDISFDKGTPFRPFEQLMGVLPAASNHAIPEVFRGLMTDDDSDIKDFYPEDFTVDLNGKKWAWQGVAILPFIDEKRLLKAMHEKYPELSEDERSRNEMGRDVLIFGETHPMYDDVRSTFYSQAQDAPPDLRLNPVTSMGLSGLIQKDLDYLPFSGYPYPGEEGEMPDIDENKAISVMYDLPKTLGTHKSLVLPGAAFPPKQLNQKDIHTTREMVATSGRNHGGAPLRGNRQGPGGNIRYTDNSRSNGGYSNGHGGPNGLPPPPFPPPPGVMPPGGNYGYPPPNAGGYGNAPPFPFLNQQGNYSGPPPPPMPPPGLNPGMYQQNMPFPPGYGNYGAPPPSQNGNQMNGRYQQNR